HKGLREVRGLLVFNMWVSNIDLNESENNKLIVRKINHKDQFYHIQHDMGFAFGKTYVERPGEFKWDLATEKDNDYVYLSYRCFQKNSGFNHITYADARWITRLIAQLGRKQIRAAVELGGWPESMGKLLVEKLTARRNQLVDIFGLTGEVLPNGKPIILIPFNRRLTTADGVVKLGVLKKNELPGYTQYFGPRIKELIPLILRHIRNTAVDVVVGGLSAIRYLKVDPKEFLGGDVPMISRILVRIKREIERNPKPTGANDTFLVQDTMRIGFRLGYGTTLSGNVSYVRQYSAVYPVNTMDEGRYHKNFIVDVTLPTQAQQFSPQSHQKFALLVEDFLEAKARVKVGGNHHT
ncbi:MAG: hypothetical protein GY940_14635, partial [bacterium]|nr:hypothetical protein [bacterium]